MKKKDKRIIWQTPWGYPESILATGGILLMGFLLQLTIGSFDFYLLARPVNLIAGAVLVIISTILGVRAKRSCFVKWFSDIPVAVTLIMTLLLLTLIMGLIPQISGSAESRSPIGFDEMTRSWPFVLLYLLTLLSLGTLLTRRLFHFRLRNYAFYLNHLGLWLLLFSAGLGYADMERYVMYVREGETEWRVYDQENQVKELPIAIQLNDFDMDVYPPKLAVIDRNTGEVQPGGEPQYFQLDNDIPVGKLNGWNIEVKKYIHQAVRRSDSTYHEVPIPGATPAVRISAWKNGETTEGWICGGNQAQLYMTLPLNEQYSVVMTAAEPRSFQSDIEVYTPDGETSKTVLEVNKPLRVGSWTIYQYGYDNNAGRLSSYSSFELVYDPWLIPVYIGIILMMFGSVCMLWNGKNRKGGDNDME